MLCSRRVLSNVTVKMLNEFKKAAGCRISGNYSFSNLEIVENLNSCQHFIFLHNQLIFCCRNYSREETIKGRKLYGKVQ